MKKFLLKDSNFSLQNVEQPMFVQFSSASVQFSSASFRTQFSPVRVQLVIKVSTSLLRKIKHLKIRNSLLFIFSSIEKNLSWQEISWKKGSYFVSVCFLYSQIRNIADQRRLQTPTWPARQLANLGLAVISRGELPPQAQGLMAAGNWC